jgi:hypothetical protein
MGADPANNVDPTGGFIPGGIPCPGTSGFGLFMQGVGNALSKALPTLTTVATIGAPVMKGSSLLSSITQANPNYIQNGSKEIGRSRRNPGQNYDRTPAEDMSEDCNCNSDGLNMGDIGSKSDNELFRNMRELFDWVTQGDMKKVGREMIDRFRSNVGGEYTSPILNREVAKDNDFNVFARNTARDIQNEIRRVGGNLDRARRITINPPNFSDFRDKKNGLGITIHDVWSAKVDISNYKFNAQTGAFSGRLKFTLYDHFGLDRQDVIGNGDRWLIPPNGGRGFKSWYTLQHCRCYRPFVTKVELN